MLIGSKSERMAKLGLNRLSTFGILADFAQPEVVHLIDALADAGLVESDRRRPFRPVVDISEAGREYLKAKGAMPLQLALPDDLSAKVRFGGLAAAHSRSRLPSPPSRSSEPSDEPVPSAESRESAAFGSLGRPALSQAQGDASRIGPAR